MSADFDSPLARARVVLKDATHAGNIGAGARAIKAMGITRLVLVAPKAEIDDSARARAKSAADVLAAARVTPDLPSALTGAHFVIAFTARRRELSPLEAGARAAARAAARRLREGREVALVFGGEQSGLGNDDLLLADIVARIDSDPTCSSLNLAQAAQIGAYELRQALREGGGLQRLTPPPSRAQASAEHKDGLLAHFVEAFEQSGMLRDKNARVIRVRLARLLTRANPDLDEINLLRGFLRARAQADED